MDDVTTGPAHQSVASGDTPHDGASGDVRVRAGGEVVFGPSPPQAVSMARVGNLRWAELQAFAVVGSWVVTTPEHDVRVALDAVSRHAAWRAQMLGDRLPTVGALAVDVVTVPRHAGLVAVVEEMATVQSTADRLAVLDDVMIAGLVEATTTLIDTLSPVADAPLLRALPMVVADLRRDGAVVAALRADADNGSGGSDASDASAALVSSPLVDLGGW